MQCRKKCEKDIVVTEVLRAKKKLAVPLVGHVAFSK